MICIQRTVKANTALRLHLSLFHNFSSEFRHKPPLNCTLHEVIVQSNRRIHAQTQTQTDMIFLRCFFGRCSNAYFILFCSIRYANAQHTRTQLRANTCTDWDSMWQFESAWMYVFVIEMSKCPAPAHNYTHNTSMWLTIAVWRRCSFMNIEFQLSTAWANIAFRKSRYLEQFSFCVVKLKTAFQNKKKEKDFEEKKIHNFRIWKWASSEYNNRKLFIGFSSIKK